MEKKYKYCKTKKNTICYLCNATIKKGELNIRLFINYEYRAIHKCCHEVSLADKESY